MDRIAHILVAAGKGSRFGGEVPKQYRLLAGLPVAFHALKRLRAATPGCRVVVAVAPGCEGEWEAKCRRHGLDPAAMTVVAGGATRFESVARALQAVDPRASVITVHDAARPLPAYDVVCRLVEAVAGGATGAVPVVPVTDSLRLVAPDGSHRAVDRAAYRAVQTPQAFDAASLRAAYAAADAAGAFTDDASVVEAWRPGSVTLVEGSPLTLKITHAPDLAACEGALAASAPVYLMGMPASGKTTLGEALARATGRPFIDIDRAIQAAEGMTVSEIFARHGEARFRALEAETLRRTATAEGAIVATGGGTPCSAANFDFMDAYGLTVCLEAGREALVRRLREAAGTRPLVGDDPGAYVDRTLHLRSQAYARARHTFDTTRLDTPEEIAGAVERFITRFLHQ